MAKRGRFYLGRVVKLGRLNQPLLLEAIRHAESFTLGKYTWTITDVAEGLWGENTYIFGKLAKFSREGRVTVVDSERKSQVDADAPNLLVASSPFVYIPDFSGIAYLHVWNGIQQDVFTKRFKKIIEATCGNFFIDCNIEPIADYRSFRTKLAGIERITELSARVHPPNPLFGRCWKSLNEYVRSRNVDEVSVKETKEDGSGIASRISDLIQAVLEDPDYDPNVSPAIMDAALLMAADGYGIGKVTGFESDSLITIRTSETQKSFLFSKEPISMDLAKEAIKHLNKTSQERGLRHGKRLDD